MSPAPNTRPVSARVLMVLADPWEAQTLEAALVESGSEVECADASGAGAALGRAPWTAVLADADATGMELVRLAQELESGPPVILLAGFGTIADAVEAMRRGAFDYVARPVPPERLLVHLARAGEHRALERENRELRATLERTYRLGHLQTRDERMRRVLALIETIADTRATVLLCGESGTGKTLLARTIHARSSRAARPCVVVDCGALPPTLLESELFGHARGAFTGAVRDKPGLVESADGGTLFLDEIATASLDLQAKLLRVVQERVFERVGETRTRAVDVRLIAATNRDLRGEVAAGRFRQDLYYRINVVRLDLPPLRERPGDVPLLAAAFLERYAREHARPAARFGPAALSALTRAPWPGNVRELENAVERAVLLAPGSEIRAEDLGSDVLGAGQAPGPQGTLPEPPLGPLKEGLEGPERALIARALAASGGSRTRAAALLGINRTTLFNKMRKYDLLGTPIRPGPVRP